MLAELNMEAQRHNEFYARAARVQEELVTVHAARKADVEHLLQEKSALQSKLAESREAKKSLLIILFAQAIVILFLTSLLAPRTA